MMKTDPQHNEALDLWLRCVQHAVAHFTDMPAVLRGWFVDSLMLGRPPDNQAAAGDADGEALHYPGRFHEWGPYMLTGWIVASAVLKRRLPNSVAQYANKFNISREI